MKKNNYKIAAIVLCGGKSSRMGVNKLLLSYKNKSILSHSVNSIKKTKIFFQILYVFPKKIDKELLAQITSLQIDYIKNPEKIGIIHLGYYILANIWRAIKKKQSINLTHNTSMLLSLYYGLIKLPYQTDLVAIFLGDMPKLNHKNIFMFINQVLAIKQTSQNVKIFQPLKLDQSMVKLGHPLVIDYNLAIKIFNYEACIKHSQPKQLINLYLKKYPKHKKNIKTKSNNFFFDIDTPADYNKLKNEN